MRRLWIPTLLLAALSSAAPPVLAGPHAPDATFQIRLGAFLPSGDSNFWHENEALFTLDESDFDGAVFGLSFVRSLSEQVDFGVNLDFYDRTELAAYRDFVDENGQTILHDTRLAIVPLTFDVRFVPGGRYRGRPRGAPIPHAAFYIGGGAGIDFWEYEEVGDFLDFSQDPPLIFPDRFQDEGVALEGHVLAGVEIPVSRRVTCLVEGRYSWASEDLGGDFDGLGRLDLSGASLFGGVGFRF